VPFWSSMVSDEIGLTLLLLMKMAGRIRDSNVQTLCRDRHLDMEISKDLRARDREQRSRKKGREL